MPLEDYYVGDRVFYTFAKTADSELDKELSLWSESETLLELCKGDRLLARAIFYLHRTLALHFMNSKIPALEDSTPLECLESWNGTDRLKECLLRSH